MVVNDSIYFKIRKVFFKTFSISASDCPREGTSLFDLIGAEKSYIRNSVRSPAPILAGGGHYWSLLDTLLTPDKIEISVHSPKVFFR